MSTERLPSSSFSTSASSWSSLLDRLAACLDSSLPPSLLSDADRGAELVQVVGRAFDVAAHLGPLRGRCVAVFASGGLSWVEAFWGVVLAGGVVLPLSPLHPDRELAWFVRDADAQTILVSEDQASRASVWARDRRISVVTALPSVTSTEALASRVQLAARERSPEDGALLLYTSGTTGKPKGVTLSHANLAHQAEALIDAWGMVREDVLLHTLPLHHVHGIVVALLTATLAGASVKMLPKFDATAVWQSFALGEVSVYMAVPTMYTRLFEALDAASEVDRSRYTEGARALRLATSGSAALPVRLAERWRALTGVIPLERYGMTEIGIALSNGLAPTARKPGFVGGPIRFVEIRLTDDAGAPTERGPGELWVRGPNVFRGYHGRDEATAEAFHEGWFRTGDLAERGEDGAVRLLGRTSVDILKSGGYKLSALEIEEVLRDYDAIAEVAVVGIPDETWGDRVVAAVTSAPGRESECTAERVRAFCADRLAPYKIPRQVVVLAALPRNAMGKVVKPDVVQAIADATRNVKNSP